MARAVAASAFGLLFLLGLVLLSRRFLKFGLI
jgi:hypothetical protein